jgi:Uma2 family endonuclease
VEGRPIDHLARFRRIGRKAPMDDPWWGRRGRLGINFGWGRIGAMAPERGAHLRVKAAVWQALRNAIKTAGVACQALPDGATIETGESDYAPDAVMNCRAPTADNATTAPNPTIIIEVLSPRTVASDTGAKLVDYFQVPSVAHYLIVHATKRVITHHRRTSEGIDTRIVVAGKLVMYPPGITITLEEIYDAG